MIFFSANNRKQKTVFLHIASWAALCSVVILLQPTETSQDLMAPYRSQFQQMNLIHLTLLIIVFYLNAYLLVPAFLYKKKIALYLLVLTGILIGYFKIINLAFSHLLGEESALQNIKNPPPLINGQPLHTLLPSVPVAIVILPFIMSLGASIIYRYMSENFYKENIRKEQQMAALTTELQFLKSQVSPHFLFNVLNNLSYLARKKSDLLEPALIKLSSLLRYMLYDTDEEKVMLDKEIKYLHDYIDLQRLRHHDLRINAFLYNHYDQLTIAPMLLIPFVENSFKHTAGFFEDHNFIKIELRTEQNKLFFSVYNKCSDKDRGMKEKDSGIGLSNVRKRLSLLYPSRHHLSIEKKNDVFMVALEINLN